MRGVFYSFLAKESQYVGEEYMNDGEFTAVWWWRETNRNAVMVVAGNNVNVEKKTGRRGR